MMLTDAEIAELWEIARAVAEADITHFDVAANEEWCDFCGLLWRYGQPQPDSLESLHKPECARTKARALLGATRKE